MTKQYSSQAVKNKRAPTPLSLREPLQVATAVIRAVRTGRAWDGQAVSPYGSLADLYRELLEEGLPQWHAQHQGYLYLAVNASWPGVLKIGCTRRSVEARMASLSTAGVATPWRALWSLVVHDAHYLEAKVHHACAQSRLGKEFFSTAPEFAQALVQQVTQADAAQLTEGLQLWVGPAVLEACFGPAPSRVLH